MPFLLALALGFVGTLLFLAPHHRATLSPFRKRSLVGCALQLFDRDGFKSPGRMFMWAAAMLGCVGVFIPAFAALALRFISDPSGARWLLLATGLLALLAAPASVLVMVISHMTFGFGGGNPAAPVTPMLRIIPIYLALCGVIAIAGAVHTPTLQTILRLTR